MMKVFTVTTQELDNLEMAVQDIMDQLDRENKLLTNTVGLLFCHLKFIEMGIVGPLCQKLPFDVLGCTSMFFATPAGEGDIMLSLTVLTSDDIEFATGVCEPLTEHNAEECINAMYEKTASSLGGVPDLIFAFPPTLFNLPIDVMTAILDRACGGIPIFGTAALDVEIRARNPYTIYRGEVYSDRMPLLLFKGPLKPRFFSLSFPAKSVLVQDAVITRADGPRLISINNEPAAAFLKELGLIQNSQGMLPPAIPLVVEGVDGAKAEVLVVQTISPDGTLICGRHIQEGRTLNIGAIGAYHVLESARTLFSNIKDSGGGTWLFVISCFLRAVVLGEGSTAEVAVLRQELDSIPDSWLFINSGGELCPEYTEFGEIKNQGLQYSIIACQL